MAEITKLERKVKVALDETRLLILGAQILLGFQFIAAFQDLFADLPRFVRALHAAALFLMVACIGFLIAPSMQHRIVERGRESVRILHVAGGMAAAALILFAVSLGIGMFTTLDRVFGLEFSAAAGSAFLIVALILWFVPALFMKEQRRKPLNTNAREDATPLATRVDQMLTEARVVLPGAQALLGFQLTVTLMTAFNALPAHQKLVHVIALALVALAVILLMTPAALHRIALGGHDTEGFLRAGSGFLVAATVPLAAGISGDLYVAAATAVDETTGIVLGTAAFVVLCVLWYAAPLILRARTRA
jgi:hypothetical protein